MVQNPMAAGAKPVQLPTIRTRRRGRARRRNRLALLGLLAAGMTGPTQSPGRALAADATAVDGSWMNRWGRQHAPEYHYRYRLPRVFYLSYNLYRQYFRCCLTSYRRTMERQGS